MQNDITERMLASCIRVCCPVFCSARFKCEVIAGQAQCFSRPLTLEKVSTLQILRGGGGGGRGRESYISPGYVNGMWGNSFGCIIGLRIFEWMYEA